MVDTLRVADANRAFADAMNRNQGLQRSSEAFIDGAGQAAASGGASFGDMLEQSMRGAIDKGKMSEQKSVEAIFRKTDLPELVTAIQEAEVALQAVASVRNRVITAYQDIIKMPV